jgi:hypothetical protein
MAILRAGQKRARDAAEAADGAEAELATCKEWFERAKEWLARAENEVKELCIEFKSAEKKAKELRTVSNRLHPEPKFEPETHSEERKTASAGIQTEPATPPHHIHHTTPP